MREDDGLAGISAIANLLAGLDTGTEDPAPKKPAKAKLTPPVDLDEDDDEDELDPAARGHAEPTKNPTPGTDPADSFDPDAPVLGDEEDADGEADGAEDPDGTAEQDDENTPQADRLKHDNFKLREARRQLKADLEATQKQVQDLEAKLATVQQASTTAPSFSGYFAQVAQVEDVAQVEAQLQTHLDYLEDNEDGYTYTDPNTGEEKEVSKQQVRQYKRALTAQLRAAPKVRETLEQHRDRAVQADTLARKKYPFVFDPKAKLNERVLDAAQEFPELSRSPARALALGRLAIGKLVESGDYMLVKRSAAPSPRSAAPARSTAPSAPPPIPGRNGHRQQAPQDALGTRIARGDRDAMEEAALAMITPRK